MALIDRVSRLFAADFHAVLDRLEEPAVLLRHAVREMEEALAQTEQDVRRIERRHATLAERGRKLAHAITAFDEEIGIAFDAGDEALARKLVKRKLEHDKLARHIAGRHEASAAALAARTAALEEQRERLDGMRQKADVFAADAPETTAENDPGLGVGADEVEVAFLRERQQRVRS